MFVCLLFEPEVSCLFTPEVSCLDQKFQKEPKITKKSQKCQKEPKIAKKSQKNSEKNSYNESCSLKPPEHFSKKVLPDIKVALSGLKNSQKSSKKAKIYFLQRTKFRYTTMGLRRTFKS